MAFLCLIVALRIHLQDGQTALMKALRILQDGLTPLMKAAFATTAVIEGTGEIVGMLLEAKADPDIRKNVRPSL